MTPTASTLTYDVFISYARKDGEPHAAKLETVLPRPWRDKRGINPAQDFTAEIERAIRDSAQVVVCVTPDVTREDSFVRQEVAYAAYLRKPIIVARFEEVPPPLPVFNHTWLDFFRLGWDEGVKQLHEWLKRFASGHYVVPEPPQALAADSYRDYAGALYDAIVSYLDQTVIRLIDVTTHRTPDAVPVIPTRTLPTRTLLASFKARAGINDAEQPVDSVDAAMTQYQGRVLLLGEPGAGKTTALMSYARQRVSDRLNNPAAPLPVLLRCAQWESSPPQPLNHWIAESTGLPADAAQAMQTQGKLLLLLDGLDELGASRTEKVKEGDRQEERPYDPRKRFLDQTLPAAGPVMLSCRVQDYADIHQQAKLNGAVTLQPLTDEQIQDYLRDLPDLWAALQADAGLLGIARTPLLLSFFAYGFKDAPEEAKALRDLSKAQLGDKIFERYVHERYAHEERRLKDMGQTPPFTLDEIYEVLGHVAMINASGSYRRGGLHEAWGEIQDNVLLERDFVEKLDAPQVLPLITFSIALSLLTRINATLRFIHLRLRDHLVRRYCLPRLRNAVLYTLFYEPNPAKALASLPDGEAVDNLLTVLAGDAAAGVRQVAAETLGRIGDRRAVDALLAALAGDANRWVRRSAADALGNIGGERAMNALLAALTSDADHHVRGSAAGALGSIGGARAVDALLAALAGDAAAGVRQSVAHALGSIGGERAMNALLAVLAGDADLQVRGDAAFALGRIGGDRAVEGLLAALAGDAAANVRGSAAGALGSIGEARAVDGLLAALAGDADADVRGNAADALGRIGGERAMNALLATLAGDADLQVRGSATRVLVWIGDTRAVDALLAALAGDAAAGVRGNAADALGRIGEARAVDALLAALAGDAAAGVRGNAADALGRIGNAQAMDGLLAALVGDADANVRRDAAYALGKIGEARAVNGLFDILLDGNNEQLSRLLAGDVLGDTGGKSIETRLVEVVSQFAGGEVDDSQLGAAFGLAILNNPKALPVLVQALENSGKLHIGDEIYRISDIAAEALERIGTLEALEAVRQWREREAQRGDQG